MPHNIQFTPSLIEKLGLVVAELANLKGIQSGVFLPKGPVTIPLASSKTTRELARKVGIPVIRKCAVFVINSEQDLPRVFMDVRHFASELNSIKRLLSPKLLEALGSWSPSAAVAPVPVAGDLSGEEGEGGVIERNIPITAKLLEGLRLLNDVFAEWEPAQYGIFASAGPLTVVLRMSPPARVIAHSIGISSWGRCEVMFITGEESAVTALAYLQQMVTKVAEMLASIPPKLLETESKTVK